MAKMKKKIYVDLDDAVNAAAKQNFDRDVRMDVEDPSNNIPDIYYKEAKALLLDTGENYQPELPDVDWIVYQPVKK